MLALARHRVVIARPIETVWQALLELEREPRSGAPLLGESGAPLDALAREAPQKLALASRRAPLRARFDFELRALPERETALQWSVRAREAGVLARVAAEIARARLRRTGPQALEALRQRIESERPTMRGWVERGGVARLARDCVSPAAGSGEVLIRVAACRPAQPPGAAGIAGSVVACGPAVRRWQAGEEVLGATAPGLPGGWAELAAVPAAQLAPRPARLDACVAAKLAADALVAGPLLAAADLPPAREGVRVLLSLPAGPAWVAAALLAGSEAEVSLLAPTAPLEQLARTLGIESVASLEAAAGRFDAVLDARGTPPEQLLPALAEKRGRCVRLAAAAPAARSGSLDAATRAARRGGERLRHRGRCRACEPRADGELLRRLVARIVDGALPLPEVHTGALETLLEACDDEATVARLD